MTIALSSRRSSSAKGAVSRKNDRAFRRFPAEMIDLIPDRSGFIACDLNAIDHHDQGLRRPENRRRRLILRDCRPRRKREDQEFT